METLIEASAAHGAEDVVVGMAHRGRLNLLINVLGLTPRQLLSLFSERPDPTLAAWDLKDHLGCSTRKQTVHGEVGILLAHNPSHLGAVSPVVCGMARALQDRKTPASSRKVVPVLMHGDAAFPGQGIVAETLNLSQTRGYSVGGTIHVIVNNQIGSTISDPRDSRSTMHCADLARAIDAPIVHVNADDPEAVVTAARMSAAFRARFAADIVVNLVGYRRHGHFGGDDPTMTQPAMQRRIRSHRSVPRLYAEALADRGVTADYEQVEGRGARQDSPRPMLRCARPTCRRPRDDAVRGIPAPQNARAVTAVPIQQLRIDRRSARAHSRPACVLHDGVQRIVDKWQALADDDEHPLDWCFAESLAYGSLLANGFNVRLTGLDVGRGSFFHRHAVWHDQRTEVDGQNVHVPLRHLGNGQGYFSIFESPLSEEAVLGFEYGYALHCGRDLVVWEAQFGDFVNNAQAIIDQFIASGERKWGYANGLVIFLPHGNEGGGAEHSSGYLGRFLQLCGDDNLRDSGSVDGRAALPPAAASGAHRSPEAARRHDAEIRSAQPCGVVLATAGARRRRIPAADRRARRRRSAGPSPERSSRAASSTTTCCLCGRSGRATRCRDPAPRRAVSVPIGSAGAGAGSLSAGCATWSGRRRKRAIMAHGICCATMLEAALPAGVTLHV